MLLKMMGAVRLTVELLLLRVKNAVSNEEQAMIKAFVEKFMPKMDAEFAQFQSAKTFTEIQVEAETQAEANEEFQQKIQAKNLVYAEYDIDNDQGVELEQNACAMDTTQLLMHMEVTVVA
jgi:hypothetical protein